ncbi:MAG: PH domain-containing protein [Vulcanimicrobiaceae bacterium]
MTLVALLVRIRPIIKGHHVNLPLYAIPGGGALLTIGCLMLIAGLFALLGASIYYATFRIVATNRRVFVITGLLGRMVVPLANTALAECYLVQGLFGRWFDFGTIVMTGRRLHDMRRPIALYRSLQAVGQGVDGDRWKAARRQTLVP